MIASTRLMFMTCFIGIDFFQPWFTFIRPHHTFEDKTMGVHEEELAVVTARMVVMTLEHVQEQHKGISNEELRHQWQSTTDAVHHHLKNLIGQLS